MNATAESWEHEPFGEAMPIPYGRCLSDSEYRQIQLGLVPEVMEDKWFIYFDEPCLFLHRSWTGEGIYRVDFAPIENGFKVVGAYRAIGEEREWAVEYEAALLDFLIANLLLGEDKPFPMLPDLEEPDQGVFQHVVSGTAFPEKTFKN